MKVELGTSLGMTSLNQCLWTDKKQRTLKALQNEADRQITSHEHDTLPKVTVREYQEPIAAEL